MSTMQHDPHRPDGQQPDQQRPGVLEPTSRAASGTDHRTGEPVPHTMRAVVQERFGTDPHEVLDVADVAVPAPRSGEVLVRVRAASIDRGTWHLMAGRPYAVRLAGVGVRRPRFVNPGRSLAGAVVAVGDQVTGLVPGDEVYGTGSDALAQYAVASTATLAAKPAGASWEEAASLPVSGLTALQAVRDRGHVGPGQSVLVIGAGGGVGSLAVQIAAACGAEVTGVSGPSKVDFVRSLGASKVIDYSRQEIDHDGRTYDVILDIGGHRPLSLLRRTLTPAGILVIVGSETGGRLLGGLDRQLRAHLLSPFVRQTLGTFISSENTADLDALRRFVDTGEVRPVVDRVVPLEETPSALHDLVGGGIAGKAVVRPPQR